MRNSTFKDPIPGAAKPKKQTTRKCSVKECPVRFVKRGMGHIVCSPNCFHVYIARKREADRLKAEKKSDRDRKEALKTRSDYIKEAQVAFNSYVRHRDAGKLCICCDRPLQAAQIGGGFDCGHYRSVGSAPHLRFDERNAHGQTKQCNRYGAGRAVDYRIGLIKRIGLEAVEDLECDQDSRNWSISDLKTIKVHYREKLKELKSKN